MGGPMDCVTNQNYLLWFEPCDRIMHSQWYENETGHWDIIIKRLKIAVLYIETIFSN